MKEPGIINHEALFLPDAKGLKTTFNLEENIKYIIIEIPDNDMVYIFESGVIVSLECRDRFEGSINSISIKSN